MHKSLIILIVLTVVVLVAILMTSPTCKNAVGSIFGGKGKRVEAPKAPRIAPRSDVSSRNLSTNPDHPANLPVSTPAVTPVQPKTEVKSDPQFRVLSGNVLDMFNSILDVEAEFGITEEEINRRAEKYKNDHIDIHEEEVTRHRSIIRSQFDEADALLRDGYQRNFTHQKKPNTEEAIIAMREEKLMNGEDLTQKRKKPAKMVMTTRKH